MKISIKKAVMTGISVAAVTLAAGFMMVSGQTNAIGEGQVEGGDIYRVKNITKNSNYANTQTADKCDVLQYKIRLHNPGPGILTNVNVKASLPASTGTTHASTATITSQNAQPGVTSANATVYTSTAQSLSYVPGSTQLLNTLSNPLTTLPDGVIGSGVNVGEVRVSLNEIKFVQFQVKVDCGPVVTPSYSCDALTVTKLTGRTARYIATASAANGATIQGYVFNFGDGKEEVSASNVINHTYAADGTYNSNVKVQVLVNGQTVTVGGNNCNASVTFETPVTPSYSCDMLTVSKTGKGREVKMTLNGTAAGGAVIKKYIFHPGDGSKQIESDGNTINYTYAKDGTYNIRGELYVLVNQEPKWVGGNNCNASVTFETPVTPSYSCDMVTIEKTGGRTIKITAKASAANGATIKRYIYNYGDGSSELTTDKNEVSYTYAKDGQYNVKVKVQVGVGNETITTESANCIASVSFTTPTTPTTPTPPTEVKALPETGAGGIAATFLAVTGLSTLGYYIIGRRSARV